MTSQTTSEEADHILVMNRLAAAVPMLEMNKLVGVDRMVETELVVVGHHLE